MARAPSKPRSKTVPAPAPQTLDEMIAHQMQEFAPGGPSHYALIHALVPDVAFQVGQAVHAGARKDMVVARVLEGGKLLALCEAPLREYPDEVSIFLAPEVQVKEMERKENFMQGAPTRINYSQRDVRGILYIARRFGCDMDPEYQRGLVWEPHDQVKLIDSIFNNVDIGKFVFRELPYEKEGACYEIIDGKQRLTALLDFTADKFAYRGVKWSEFSQADRKFLMNYPIAYAELGQDISRKQAMEVFLRLNTGGKPVSEEHLNKVRSLLESPRPSTPRP